MAEIVCLGVMVADIVGKPIDALPARGTLALIDRVELHIGGNAANAAAALGKLGEPVGVAGGVGADSLGEYMTGALERAGVDTAALRRYADTPTAASLVTVHSDAERSFLHAAGANAAFGPDEVDWTAMADARFLLIAGLQLMVRLEGDAVAQIAREARRRGMTTVLDTVMNPRSTGWAGLAPALPHLDWCVPSYDEARLLTGESEPEGQVRALRNGGAGNVAIKLGAAGCLLAETGRASVRVPAFPADVVDTLGAGDSWCAGFLAGLRRGWSGVEAARLGNAVAADCVSALGATAGIRPLAEVLERLGSPGA